MAKKNPGKAFEEDFKKSVPEDCFVYRFKDGTANFNGAKNENVRFQAKNICDFMVMTKEDLVLMELKSHASVSIPFGCIRNNQIEEMSKIEHPKVKTYFILNFRDLEKTFAIGANELKGYMETSQRKSIPFTWCEEHGIEIIGIKKKVRYKYDLEKFFGEMDGIKQINLKENLDKRICDCEDGQTNTQTYRDYIRASEEEFGIAPAPIDGMEEEELQQYLNFMDELWNK